MRFAFPPYGYYGYFPSILSFFDLLGFRHQQALQFFGLIYHFFAGQLDLSMHHIIENPRLPCMFSPIHPGSQGLRGITRLNGNRESKKYRAAVIFPDYRYWLWILTSDLRSVQDDKMVFPRGLKLVLQLYGLP